MALKLLPCSLLLLVACQSGNTDEKSSAAQAVAGCSTTSYDAATQMSASSGGPDRGGWGLWNEGALTTWHDFSTGQTTVTVKAAGDIAAEVAPHMTVYVNGSPIGEADVWATNWTDYSFSFAATEGVQELRVVFSNDFYDGNQDRNLLIQSVTVSCASTWQACNGHSPCTVMPLGDSITAGYVSSTEGGYRVELFHRALADGKAITFVGSHVSGPSSVDGQPFPPNSEGHPGYCSDELFGCLGILPLLPAALDSYQPDVVLLLIGTNDISFGIDLPNLPNRAAMLVDTITSKLPNTLVLVSTILPRRDDPQGTSMAQYNQALPGWVEARAREGKHVDRVDAHAAFLNDANWASDYLGDDVHPNDFGHQVLGDAWYESLKTYLP